MSVMASIRSYRTLCIRLQEFLYKNLIHPSALQQLQDFPYAIHCYNAFLHDLRRSNSFLNPYIIEVQPPFPGRTPKQQPARRPRTTSLAIFTRPSFLQRNKRNEKRRKRKKLQCLILLKLFLG